MDENVHGIPLDGRMLTHDRGRNNAALAAGNGHEPRELLQVWIEEAARHWKFTKDALLTMGPSKVWRCSQKKWAATRATIATELAVATRGQFLNRKYDNLGENFNYEKRFEAAVTELLDLLKDMVETLRLRTEDMQIPDSLKEYKDDTRGGTLLGRIDNLMVARHLCVCARAIGSIKDRYEHPSYLDWTKLYATVERNLQAAVVDHAKELEAFCNERKGTSSK